MESWLDGVGGSIEEVRVDVLACEAWQTIHTPEEKRVRANSKQSSTKGLSVMLGLSRT